MQRQSKGSGKPLPTSAGTALSGLGSRINAAVTEIGSLVRAGEIAGVTDEAIARWRNGTSKPPFAGIVALCEAARFSVEWMATGEGPRDMQPTNALSQMRTQQARAGGGMNQVIDPSALEAGMVLLPRMSVEASAGQGIVPDDEAIEGFMAFKAEFLREIGINPSNAHVLQIKGDSMYPTLKDRDVIIIDASVIEALEEGLYTIVLGDVVKAKRLQPLANGSVRIISDNQDEGYRDEIVPRSDLEGLRIVGRIRGVYRNF